MIGEATSLRCGRSSNQRLFWGGPIIVFRIFPSSYAEKLLGLVAFWCSWNSPRFWSQKKTPTILSFTASCCRRLRRSSRSIASSSASFCRRSRKASSWGQRKNCPETMLQIARKKWRIPMILPKKWWEETLIWSTVVFWGCLRLFLRKKNWWPSLSVFFSFSALVFPERGDHDAFYPSG